MQLHTVRTHRFDYRLQGSVESLRKTRSRPLPRDEDSCSLKAPQQHPILKLLAARAHHTLLRLFPLIAGPQRPEGLAAHRSDEKGHDPRHELTQICSFVRQTNSDRIGRWRHLVRVPNSIREWRLSEGRVRSVTGRSWPSSAILAVG